MILLTVEQILLPSTASVSFVPPIVAPPEFPQWTL